MQQSDEMTTEAKLKVLIRHLVLSFPEAGILSRQVGDRYHVFIIVPYGGGPEKTIQVERAVLAKSARSIQEFEGFLSQVNLPRLVETRQRYDLRCAKTTGAAQASTCPANEGFPSARIGGTVFHGPFQLSRPSSPTLPGALFPPYSE